VRSEEKQMCLDRDPVLIDVLKRGMMLPEDESLTAASVLREERGETDVP
jgi:hypothetical protein